MGLEFKSEDIYTKGGPLRPALRVDSILVRLKPDTTYYASVNP